MNLRHLFTTWRIKREIERNLAARRLLRPYRQAAARKGAETRRAKA